MLLNGFVLASSVPPLEFAPLVSRSFLSVENKDGAVDTEGAKGFAAGRLPLDVAVWLAKGLLNGVDA